ncbi:1632_t:CDS:2 [Paraglomus occultum]|uniref:1632_t:CDS:1 n=1 Tax=Paraglomus occultum TaxID=144539 RepID=A0A9N8YYX6_9GLOM|nr:1632_t:CDS:2 [Paraglomus occultum]
MPRQPKRRVEETTKGYYYKKRKADQINPSEDSQSANMEMPVTGKITKKSKREKKASIFSPNTPLPPSIAKYINMNSHLKGVDHGRLNPMGKLEIELDRAVTKGDLELATKLSEEISLKNYEHVVQEAIERKEYYEAKLKEEERKANKRGRKLKWGFESKRRWETKSNM